MASVAQLAQMANQKRGGEKRIAAMHCVRNKDDYCLRWVLLFLSANLQVDRREFLHLFMDKLIICQSHSLLFYSPGTFCAQITAMLLTNDRCLSVCVRACVTSSADLLELYNTVSFTTNCCDFNIDQLVWSPSAFRCSLETQQQQQ